MKRIKKKKKTELQIVRNVCRRECVGEMISMRERFISHNGVFPGLKLVLPFLRERLYHVIQEVACMCKSFIKLNLILKQL